VILNYNNICVILNFNNSGNKNIGNNSNIGTTTTSLSLQTACFLKTVPSVQWDLLILFVKRVFIEGTVFMKPAVVYPPS